MIRRPPRSTLTDTLSPYATALPSASRRTVRAATGSEPACERTEPGVSRSRAGAWSLSRRGPSQTFRVEHQPVEVVFDQTDLPCVIGRFQVLQIVVAVDVKIGRAHV